MSVIFWAFFSDIVALCVYKCRYDWTEDFLQSLRTF